MEDKANKFLKIKVSWEEKTPIKQIKKSLKALVPIFDLVCKSSLDI